MWVSFSWALLLVSAALGQEQPAFSPPTKLCSIPPLRIVPGNVDPGIARKLPPARDHMPLVNPPAPPCDEPNRLLSAVRPMTESLRLRLLGEQLKRLREKFQTPAPPAKEEGSAQPEPKPDTAP